MVVTSPCFCRVGFDTITPNWFKYVECSSRDNGKSRVPSPNEEAGVVSDPVYSIVRNTPDVISTLSDHQTHHQDTWKRSAHQRGCVTSGDETTLICGIA